MNGIGINFLIKDTYSELEEQITVFGNTREVPSKLQECNRLIECAKTAEKVADSALAMESSLLTLENQSKDMITELKEKILSALSSSYEFLCDKAEEGCQKTTDPSTQLRLLQVKSKNAIELAQVSYKQLDIGKARTWLQIAITTNERAAQIQDSPELRLESIKAINTYASSFFWNQQYKYAAKIAKTGLDLFDRSLMLKNTDLFSEVYVTYFLSMKRDSNYRGPQSVDQFFLSEIYKINPTLASEVQALDSGTNIS